VSHRQEGFSFNKSWNPVIQALKVQKAHSDEKNISSSHQRPDRLLFFSSWCLIPCFYSSLSGAPILVSQALQLYDISNITVEPSTMAASSFQYHKVDNMHKCTLVTSAQMLCSQNSGFITTFKYAFHLPYYKCSQ
jgi:hypothetical protein